MSFSLLVALRALALVVVLFVLGRRQWRRKAYEGERWAIFGAVLWLCGDALVLVWDAPIAPSVAELLHTLGFLAFVLFVVRACAPLDTLARINHMRPSQARTRLEWLVGLEAMLDELTEPVLLYDAHGQLVWANPAAEAWLGALAEGTAVEEIARYALTPAEEEAWMEAVASARAQRRRQVLPRTFLRQADGVVRPVELAAVPVGDHLVVLLRDVSWWLAREQQFQALVDEDPLTGLLNRRGLMRAAEREIARARRHRHPLALVLLDLDHFKEINDRFGHAVGDEALREFARRLKRAARASDLLARYGGEEFAILLPETDLAQAERAAERLLAEVRAEPFATSAGELVITASAGVAVFPHHGKDWNALFRAADQALYLAKRGGRNRWRTAEQLADEGALRNGG